MELPAAGPQRVVHVSISPLVGKDGQVLGRLLIFHDLTERVNLEDQLAQAEKLSSIGLLAAGVAHEVNTPLAVVTSQAQMLLKQTPVDESHKPALERVIKAAFRASEIVNSLLKFSRVSGSEHAEMDLNKMVRETLSLDEFQRGLRGQGHSNCVSAGLLNVCRQPIAGKRMWIYSADYPSRERVGSKGASGKLERP